MCPDDGGNSRRVWPPSPREVIRTTVANRWPQDILETRAVPKLSLADPADAAGGSPRPGRSRPCSTSPTAANSSRPRRPTRTSRVSSSPPTSSHHLLAVHAEKGSPGARFGLFFSTDDVILVPGFLGSSLTDETGGNGLIWVDPALVLPGRTGSSSRP